MSNIRLFESSATDFSGLGLGKLSDAISCEVTEERNGVFELEMEYPIIGKRYSQLGLRMLIVCPPNPYDTPQAFRIYSISKEYEGKIKINAQHISYDLSDVIIRDGKKINYGLNPKIIWDYITANLVTGFSIGSFTFSSNLTVDDSKLDKDGSKLTKWVLKGPKSIRNILLGDDEDCIKSKYVGDSSFGDEPEYKFDNFSISLNKQRGSETDVVIKYGKNMVGFTQEESLERLYTHVYPFFYASSITYNALGKIDGDQITIEDFTCDLTKYPNQNSSYITQPIIDTGLRDANGNALPFRHILPLDVSSLYEGDYIVDFKDETAIIRFNQTFAITNVITNQAEKKMYIGYTYYNNEQDFAFDPYWVQIYNVSIEFPGIAGKSYSKGHYFIFTELTNWEVSIMNDYIIPDSTGHAEIAIQIRAYRDEHGQPLPVQPYILEPGDLIAGVEGDHAIDLELSHYYDLQSAATLGYGALQIEKAAKRYITENRLSQYPVSLSVDMSMAEPIQVENLYKIKLCDVITVLYPSFNVATKAKCTKTVYDAMNNKYSSLDFSNSWNSLAYNTAKEQSSTKTYMKNNNYVSKSIDYLEWTANFI